MAERNDRKTISLAFTGASGAQYGLRLLEELLRQGHRVYLMMSKPAQVVIGMDTDLKLPGRPREIQRFFESRYDCQPGQLSVFDKEEWTAPVASGTGAADAMVICPCTSGTLGAIAAGISDNLIHRAADVALKERKPLLVVLRETPYSAIHLENMLKLTHAGATIMPSNPGFYTRPQSIDDLVDFMVGKILDQLGLEHDLVPRWGSEQG
ncbi:MAG: flavin prenyltransferase UbiX [Pseudomonadota bacterium]